MLRGNLPSDRNAIWRLLRLEARYDVPKTSYHIRTRDPNIHNGQTPVGNRRLSWAVCRNVHLVHHRDRGVHCCVDQREILWSLELNVMQIFSVDEMVVVETMVVWKVIGS